MDKNTEILDSLHSIMMEIKKILKILDQDQTDIKISLQSTKQLKPVSKKKPENKKAPITKTTKQISVDKLKPKATVFD